MTKPIEPEKLLLFLFSIESLSFQKQNPRHLIIVFDKIQDNVLSYASNGLGYEESYGELYRPVKIERLGKGIKNNEIIEKARSASITRGGI
jgi:hypothetical protein